MGMVRIRFETKRREIISPVPSPEWFKTGISHAHQPMGVSSKLTSYICSTRGWFGLDQNSNRFGNPELVERHTTGENELKQPFRICRFFQCSWRAKKERGGVDGSHRRALYFSSLTSWTCWCWGLNRTFWRSHPERGAEASTSSLIQ